MTYPQGYPPQAPPPQGYPPLAPPPQGYAPQQQPQQPVDREIQGVLQQVEMRQNGWHRFYILEMNKQYPTKVDTKHVDTVQQAMSLMGQPVAASIREQESTTINPNSGRPYVNRYLNAIAPAGYTPGVQPSAQQMQQQPPQQMTQQAPQRPVQAPPVMMGSQVPQPSPVVQPGVQGADRDIQICRQTAGKIVAMSLEALPPEQRNVQGMIEACEVWMAYFFHGPLRFGVTPFNQPRQAQAPPQQAPQQSQPMAQGQTGQTDIFGAPMDEQGTPIYDNDPGPQDGQVESLGQ